MPNWCFICEPKKSFSELSSVFLTSPEGEKLRAVCSDCKKEIEKLVEYELKFLSQEDLSLLKSQAEDL